MQTNKKNGNMPSYISSSRLLFIQPTRPSGSFTSIHPLFSDSLFTVVPSGTKLCADTCSGAAVKGASFSITTERILSFALLDAVMLKVSVISSTTNKPTVSCSGQRKGSLSIRLAANAPMMIRNTTRLIIDQNIALLGCVMLFHQRRKNISGIGCILLLILLLVSIRLS